MCYPPLFSHVIVFCYVTIYSHVACAFDTQGNSRDTLVIEAGENEGVYLATFDIDLIRAYREREAWGNAFRKPHRYSLLTSIDVEKPFIRTNDRGEAYERTRR